MLKKTVALMVFLVVCSLGTAFAYQIDSLGSSAEPLAPPTQVYVNPGGLGDALLFGYYNVRNNTTYFSITNTDINQGAQVKIRFKEASKVSGACPEASWEVLDFFICLTPGDMWVGAIATDQAGYGRLFSDDDDTPVKYSDTEAAKPFATVFPDGVQFKTSLIDSADQTREGHFEVIALAALDEVTSGGNCGATLLRNGDAPNALMGHTYIINQTTGAAYAYNATALADFALTELEDLGVGALRPNLATDSEDGTIYPVNYALTKNKITSIYDLATGAGSAVIVTFPTKFETQDDSQCVGDIFDDPRVVISVWDDSENPDVPVGCSFSPCEPGAETSLPEEINVVDLNESNIFSSTVQVEVASPFDFGWISINLQYAASDDTTPSPAHETCYGGYCSNGLPAIGYAVHNLGAITGMLPVHYSTNVVPNN